MTRTLFWFFVVVGIGNGCHTLTGSRIQVGPIHDGGILIAWTVQGCIHHHSGTGVDTAVSGGDRIGRIGLRPRGPARLLCVLGRSMAAYPGDAT